MRAKDRRSNCEVKHFASPSTCSYKQLNRTMFSSLTNVQATRSGQSLSSVVLALSLVACLTSCSDHADVPRAAATVSFIGTSGNSVGTAELTEDNQGQVTMKLTVNGLPQGVHGIHFHEVGLAEPKATPAFSTSGEHYNPASKKHGLENPMGTHAGDLPNLVVDSQGVGRLETTTDRISLTDGPTTLFDANGSSLIIHATADDQRTDPSGNSGGRIAGGVVIRK